MLYRQTNLSFCLYCFFFIYSFRLGRSIGIVGGISQGYLVIIKKIVVGVFIFNSDKVEIDLKKMLSLTQVYL